MQAFVVAGSDGTADCSQMRPSQQGPSMHGPQPSQRFPASGSEAHHSNTQSYRSLAASPRSQQHAHAAAAPTGHPHEANRLLESLNEGSQKPLPAPATAAAAPPVDSGLLQALEDVQSKLGDISSGLTKSQVSP